MNVSDWPMDNETWKEEYFKYENEYRYIIKEKYNTDVWMTSFMSNNIKLNNLLLNLKKKSTPKKIHRLQIRVDEFNTKLDEIQTEIENTENNREKEKLEVKKDTLVSTGLLEACEQFLLENSEKNLALAKTKLDTITVRKPTKLSELNPDIFDMVTSNLTGKGKRKKILTKKRGGKHGSKGKRRKKKSKNKSKSNK